MKLTEAQIKGQLATKEAEMQNFVASGQSLTQRRAKIIEEANAEVAAIDKEATELELHAREVKGQIDLLKSFVAESESRDDAKAF